VDVVDEGCGCGFVVVVVVGAVGTTTGTVPAVAAVVVAAVAAIFGVDTICFVCGGTVVVVDCLDDFDFGIDFEIDDDDDDVVVVGREAVAMADLEFDSDD